MADFFKNMTSKNSMGPQNTRYEILNIIYPIVSTIFLLVILSPFAIAQKRQNITLDLIEGANKALEIKKIYFSDLELTQFSDFRAPYSIQVLSLENKILFEKYFGKDLFLAPSNETKVTIPLFYTASTINFFLNGQKIASIDLVENFCKSGDRFCHNFCALKAVDSDCFYCGNGVCEKNETKSKCPQDCSALKNKSSGDLILPENILIESDDLNQEIDLEADGAPKKGLGPVFYISFGFGVLALYFLFRKK